MNSTKIGRNGSGLHGSVTLPDSEEELWRLVSGDVDVIAEKNGAVYLCECKDLSFARTISEVLEQVGHFQGKHSDDLWKHLHRVKWVKRNAFQLSHLADLRSTEVRSLLITSKVVPMQHLNGFVEQVVPIDSLPHFLANQM